VGLGEPWLSDDLALPTSGSSFVLLAAHVIQGSPNRD
jgi:hypothetical protein